MKIKVEIEIDGTLLSRLEDERTNVSQDAISVIANMARVEANEQATAYRAEVEAKREKEARKVASKEKKE